MRTRSAFLMPVYDPDPARLRRSLASMRDQTVPADIVLVDDGSPTPVAAALDASLDPSLDAGSGGAGLTVLRLSRNEGIVGALNHGLAHVLGQDYAYVARMDCGDLCLPDRIAAQEAHMDRAGDIDLLGARARIVDEAGRDLFTEGVSGGPAQVRAKLFDNAAFKHPAFFLRTASVARLGLYDPGYRHAEDYEFALRYAERGRVACLDATLIVYEKTAGGLSDRNRGAQLRSRLRAQARYFDPRRARAYLGLARTLVTMLVPARLWAAASQAYWRAGETGASKAARGGEP